MIKIALKIDQQNDFITGALHNEAAIAKIPYLIDKATRQAEEGWKFFCTLDTHKENYLETQEGQKLPIPHCLLGTIGHQIEKNLLQIYRSVDFIFVYKETFGSVKLGKILQELNCTNQIEVIEIDGFVTDICVVSNALLLKAFLPETRIVVDAAVCAGTTPENHQAALTVMKSCQIEIINQ
jgi:nicotinamidase/pyrazinamidase